MLDRHFSHLDRESSIYGMWEKSGVFRPESTASKDAPTFSMVMPPPNANGELHLGHAYGYVVMDVLGRFHRLMGERVLLLPGKDHAGIQTQVVFEKKLKAEGIDPNSLDRKDFFDRCYAFCMDRAKYMRDQERQVGISADWSREMFTLDPRVSSVVYGTFEKLWKDGLVYKGNRMVHWSTFSQTAISDVEIEYKEEKGHLWSIAYPLETPVDGISEIVVATTRPETLLGDTAIAVNPSDERYAKLIGRKVLVPFTGRSIAVIADERIDAAFGTGAVKVTPAHDFNDFEIGETHGLEKIQVIDKFGKMTEAAGGAYAGLKTSECRAKIVQDLETSGLLRGIQEIVHTVPIAERGKDVIEPLISEQWFIAVDKEGNSLKKKALELVNSGKVNVYPDRLKKMFVQWLENLRDWNISRQISWGHRMPVWYKEGDNGEELVHVGEAAPDDTGWVQETDTFDTWFSSGQWPFSTLAADGLLDLDHPEKSEYFPTHTIQMGRDILFFWACRMILLSAYRLGDVPWKNVYFSGVVRDERGQKMSKSKGNGIEPTEMIEKYGMDALRIGLVANSSPGNDLRMNEKKVEGYSKFVNKIWNAAKLVEMKLADSELPEELPEGFALASSAWMVSEVSKIQKSVLAKIAKYELSPAFEELYDFVWSKYCDWYLEIVKIQIDQGTPSEKLEAQWALRNTFRKVLTLLHPFMPFVTEEIFQSMGGLGKPGILAMSRFEPSSEVAAPASFDRLFATVSAIRSVRSMLCIPPNKRLPVHIDYELVPEIGNLVSSMACVTPVPNVSAPKEGVIVKPTAFGSVSIETEGKEAYREKLERDLANLERLIASDRAKLASSDFIANAPEDFIEKTKAACENNAEQAEILRSEIRMN